MRRSQARASISKPVKDRLLLNWQAQASYFSKSRSTDKRAAPAGAALLSALMTLLVDTAGKKPAIDNQRLSGNEGCGIGGEKDCGSYEFFCLAETAHRRAHQ